MFVEGPGEVDIEQVLMKYGQSHHPPGKLEVAEVVRVHVRMTVRLKCGPWNGMVEWNGLETGVKRMEW